MKQGLRIITVTVSVLVVVMAFLLAHRWVEHYPSFYLYAGDEANGARVYLNDAFIGVIQDGILMAKVEPGEYGLRVIKRGYKPLKQKIRIRGWDDYHNISLKPDKDILPKQRRD
ncbi:hypothetical protein HRbin17_00583 [bacterium HR17]|jgi:hypothetical protein|uniref:PEGA domain-containing protein n=1 Tax=Candidatus Fervidibacter japonicus TaxID=2035412 RepID=A0A2H5XAF0_9BACT|nr:hypothetical protein HRbin17_00583 [bacterium HR17]